MTENTDKFTIVTEQKDNAEIVENAGVEQRADAIKSSIPQVEMSQNPFIMADESEEYKKLEKEYREYRRKKILSKIDGLHVGNLSQRDIKEEFKRLSTSAKARAVCMPCQLALAKRELSSVIKVESIINYPYASGSKNAVLTEIKEALRLKCDASVGLDLSAFISGNTKPVEKNLKMFKRLSKRARVNPMFSTDGLTVEMLGRLCCVLKQNKMPAVRLMWNGGDIKNTADAVKVFYDNLGEQCPVSVVGAIDKADDLQAIFSAGAERVITTEYLSLSRGQIENISI